eukprot:gene4609-5758_t
MKTITLILILFLCTILVFGSAQGCDPRCDCDEVEKGCPGPRYCMKPNPDDCSTFIQCNDGGIAYVMPCAPGFNGRLYWNDNSLTCEYPEDSTCSYN